MDALAGLPVPQKGGFPLVGDADGGNIRHMDAPYADRLAQRVNLAGQDGPGIMLHPAGLGENLRKLHAAGRKHPSRGIEGHRPGAGRPLIQRNQNLLRHT